MPSISRLSRSPWAEAPSLLFDGHLWFLSILTVCSRTFFAGVGRVASRRSDLPCFHGRSSLCVAACRDAARRSELPCCHGRSSRCAASSFPVSSTNYPCERVATRAGITGVGYVVLPQQPQPSQRPPKPPAPCAPPLSLSSVSHRVSLGVRKKGENECFSHSGVLSAPTQS